MDFYFVITKSMLEKYGMGSNYWTLDSANNRHCFYAFHETTGDALNSINIYKKDGEKYAICRAKANNSIVCQALTCALSGGEQGLSTIGVIVDEITWIN